MFKALLYIEGKNSRDYENSDEEEDDKIKKKQKTTELLDIDKDRWIGDDYYENMNEEEIIDIILNKKNNKKFGKK